MNHILNPGLPKTSAAQDLLAMMQGGAANASLQGSQHNFAAMFDQSVRNTQQTSSQNAFRAQETTRSGEPQRTPQITGRATQEPDRRNAEPARSSEPQRNNETQAPRESSPDRTAQSTPGEREGQVAADKASEGNGSEGSGPGETGIQEDAATTNKQPENTGTAPSFTEQFSVDDEEATPEQPGNEAEIAALTALVAALSGKLPAEGSGETLPGEGSELDLLDASSGDKKPLAQLRALLAEAQGEGGQADAGHGGEPNDKQQGQFLAAASSKSGPRVTVAQIASAAAEGAQATAGAAKGLTMGAGLQAAGSPEQTLGTVQAQNNSTRSTSNVQQLPVYTPAGKSGWAEDVGTRMIWMSNRGETKAELVLTPPSLGRLGVSISVNGEQTNAHFVAATPAAREALEQALPRLREMLQQAGINLGQTDVSTSGDQQAHGEHGSEQRGHGSSRGSRHGTGQDIGLSGMSGVEPSTSGGQWIKQGNGMVDTFA
ncbi:MAG: flagellar hook-length control protein FliK [Rhodocyclaceae bacterium]